MLCVCEREREREKEKERERDKERLAERRRWIDRTKHAKGV